MIRTSSISQYSPDSEENSEDQPLDFSKKTSFSPLRSSSGPISLKSESNDHRQKSPISTNNSSNYLTTPSPSPPEHQSNQVLCQLLTGNLIPTSTGKVVPASNSSDSLNGRVNSSSPELGSPPNNSIKKEKRGYTGSHRRNPSLSPSGSSSPIGLGPLNQVDVHFPSSPNPSGVDRFGTSGGLLTTAPMAAGVIPAFPGADAKRAFKYNRPFKAYPRDPLSIPMGYYGVPIQMPLTTDAIATQSILASQSDQAYLQFREQMLVSRKNSQVNRSSSKSAHNSSNGSIDNDHVKQEHSLISSPKSSQNTHSNHPIQTNANTVERPAERTQQERTQQERTHHERTHQERTQQTVSTPKTNGSSSTPVMNQVHHDDNSQFSNENSSGGEGDTGSLSSHGGVNAGQSGQSMRKRGRPLPEDLKDDAYWERRRKNNEAAKRSRDARRAKEDEIAIRAAFLEQENLKLRCEVAQLKTELSKVRTLFYNN